MTSKSKRNKRAFFKKIMPFLQSYAVEMAHTESFSKTSIPSNILKHINFHISKIIHPLKLDTIYEGLFESILRSIAIQTIAPNIHKSNSDPISKMDAFFESQEYISKLPAEVHIALKSFSLTAEIHDLLDQLIKIKNSPSTDSKKIDEGKRLLALIRDKLKDLDKNYIWKLDDIRPNFLFQLHLIERSFEIGNFDILPPPS